MRTLLFPLLLAGFVAAIASPPPPAQAEDPAPAASGADELVQQLGHDDFRAREAASRKLAALGEQARPALERALEQSDSPEVRWRVEQLLRRLQGSQVRPLGEQAPASPPGSTDGQGEAPSGPTSGAPGLGGDDEDAASFVRRQLEELQRRFAGRLNVHQLGVLGRIEAPGLALERRIPTGVVLQITRRGEDGKEQVQRYEGANLADILRRHPDLEQHPGMELLKRRDAETSLPGFSSLFDDEFLREHFLRRRAAAAPGGFSFTSSEGLEVRQDASGAHVRVRSTDENGKEVVKEYQGATIEEIRQKHPELAERLGGFQIHVAPPQLFWPGQGHRRLEPLPAPVAPAPRPRFGVTLTAPDEALSMHLRLRQGEGALVEAVIPDSPAAALGLEALDVIVAIDGQPVAYGNPLVAQLAQLAADPQLPASLEIIRGGEHRTLQR